MQEKRKCLILVILKKKTYRNIIQSGHKFVTISIEDYLSEVPHLKNKCVSWSNKSPTIYWNKCKGAGINYFNNSRDFSEYWNDMGEIYKNIEENNPNEK